MKKFFSTDNTSAISLIEVLVTMSILIILIKISLGYLHTLQIETRRQEAYSELIKLKSNMEQMAVSGFVDSTPVNSVVRVAEILRDENRQINSPNKYYIITVSDVTVTDDIPQYVLTATAQGTQAEKDPNCPMINLIVTAEQDDIRDPIGCW